MPEDQPNTGAARCARLRDGQVVRLWARPVPPPRGSGIEVLATRPDGTGLGDEGAAGPVRLVLTRTVRGADATVWEAKRVVLSGAPQNVGLSTVMFDFASDVLRMTVARDASPGFDRDETRHYFDLWRLYRGEYGPTEFLDAGGALPRVERAATSAIVDPPRGGAAVRRLQDRLRWLFGGHTR